MKAIIFKTIFIFMILSTSINICWSALDDLENKLRKEEAIQLRWDNIYGPPYWVSGPEPFYSWISGLYLVELSPDSPITVRITKESYLRIHSPSESLNPSDFEILASNGSGLFVIQQPILAGKDLILPPLHFGGEIVKVRLKKEAKEKQKSLAFFISRYNPPAAMAPYRSLDGTSAEKSALLSHTWGTPEKQTIDFVNKLKPTESATVTLTGPLRINLLTFLAYTPLDTAYPFMYRLNIAIDGKPYHTGEYVARPNDGQVYYGGLTPYILSYANINPVEIPEGTHTLTIKTNAKAFFQLRELENSGYLIPWLNSPKLDERPLPPNQSALSKDQKSVKNLKNPEDRKKSAPSEIEQVAIKVGKDNTWSTSGTQSVYLLQELVQNRPDAIDLKAARDKAEGIFTLYRDLLPYRNGHLSTQSFAWGVDWDLRDPKDEGKPTFVLDSHKESLLNYLVGGFFLVVPTSQKDAPIYPLPVRTAPGYLRILVKQSELKHSQTLWVQYDQNEPVKLEISPKQDLNNESYKPSHGLTGLSLLKDPENTLGGLFNVRHNPGPLLPIGTLLVPLPRKVKEITIWSGTSGNQPLEVALQYQSSNPYRLEHPMMIEELQQTPDTLDLFYSSLKFVLTNAENKNSTTDFNTFWGKQGTYPLDKKESIAELYNHWLKLLRLLTFRHQKFIEGYDKVESIFIAPLSNGSKISDSDLKEAEMVSSKGKYYEAHQLWSIITHSSDRTIWRKGHLGRIAALQNLGESYLQERCLKAIFLKSTDDPLKTEAFKELLKLYKDQDDLFALEGLLTERYLKTRDPKVLKALSQVLLEDNNEAIAIDLAHVLKNDTEPPKTPLVYTAIKQNRGRNGERLGEKTENFQDFLFWNAQVNQTDGNYELALNQFRKSGKKGAQWADHLAAGQALRQRLFSPHPETRLSAIEDWVAWNRNSPSPRLWEPANHFVTKFYQATTLYSEQSDTYDSAYVANPDQPIQMKFIGPTQLRLKIRVLFHKMIEMPYKGWLQITDNGRPIHLPILYTYPSEGLNAIGHGSEISITERFELSFSPGEHIIEIYPQDAHIVVEPFFKNPIVPTTILPPVTHESLAQILQENKRDKECDPNFLVQVLSNRDGSNTFTKKSADPKLYQTTFSTPPKSMEEALKNIASSPKIQPYPLPEQEQVRIQMSQILWEYEQKPSEELLVKAYKLWMKNRHFSQLSRIWGGFGERSLWTPIPTPQQSAGIRSVTATESWAPDSPQTLLRKDFIKVDPEDFMLTEGSNLAFQFYNEKDTTLKVDSILESFATDDLGDIIWEYQVDNEKSQIVTFTPKKRSESFQLIIPKGEHSLKFTVKDPSRNTFIKLKINERQGEKDPWKLLEIKTKKDYLIATKEKPVIIDIEGPAWIRVDELINDQIIHKDYSFGKGFHQLTLKPTENKDESLFRVYRRLARSPEIIKPRVPPSPSYIPIEDPPLSFDEIKQPNPVRGKEILPLRNQEGGTISVTASANRVIGFAENNLVGATFKPGTKMTKVDRYIEERVTYRYYDDVRRLRYRGDILARQRHGAPTLGVLGDVEYSPLSLPITLWAKGSFYAQHFKSKQLTNQTIFGKMQQHLRSETVAAGVRHKLVYTPKLDQRINVGLLRRHVHYSPVIKVLPINPNASIPKVPDRDVFSQYLKTHPKAWDLSYKLCYRPFMDTQVRGEIWVVSKPNLELFSHDSVSSNIGIDQLLGPVVLSADYTFTRFSKNTSQSNLIPALPQTQLTQIRPFPHDRHSFDGHMTWDYWLENHDRIEMALKLSRVFDTHLPIIPVPNKPGVKQKGVNEWLGVFSLTWHFGNGRDFRDFDPEAVLFKDIRERHLPPSQIPDQRGAS